CLLGISVPPPPLPSPRPCSPFFFNDTAPTEIYTLSLHDALPISGAVRRRQRAAAGGGEVSFMGADFQSALLLLRGRHHRRSKRRSEEHTSELQSLTNLVCRLLLEKKKNQQVNTLHINHTPSPSPP